MAFGDKVQSNSGTSTVATTSPTLGVGVTSGNLIVLTFAADDYNGTPNTGWTQSSEMEQQTFHGGYLWWFIATSNGQAIPSYTIGSAVRSAWTLVEYEGPFDASPYDTSQGVFQQSSSTTITSDAMTPTSGDRLMVGGLQAQHASSDLQQWGTITGSFTVQQDVLYNGGNPRLAVSQLSRTVTANGSTSYTVGGTTPTQASQSRSANIIAFIKGAAGGGITGTASITEAGDTVSSASTIALKATASITEAGDTSTATGTVSIKGTATITEAGDTSSATGTVALKGTASITEAGDTVSATGASQSSTSGVADITEAGDTVAATGTVALKATASITEAGDTVAGTGALAIAGAASLTEAGDTVSGAGAVRIAATASMTEAGDTVTASGTSQETRTGSLAVTEAGDTLSATATISATTDRVVSIVLTGIVRGTASLSGDIGTPPTLSGVARINPVALQG